MGQDEFCAICEGKLQRKDSNHVCRKCFGKAREPKQVTVEMSDRAAQTLGLGLFFGSVVNWGIGKLAEVAHASPPHPELMKPAAGPSARGKILEIQKRLKRKAEPPKGRPRRKRRGPERPPGH